MKISLKVILLTFALKLVSIGVFLGVSLTLRYVFIKDEEPPLAISNIGFAFSEAIFFFPASLIWVLFFLLLAMWIFGQKGKLWLSLLNTILLLNFIEFILLFGHFSKLLRAFRDYGVMNTNSWRSLPDFPEVVGVIIASWLFATFYYSYLKAE
jgi:hypothetical protein